jgi:hypothetical protein
MANFQFSVAQPDIQAEIDAKYPTYGTERQVKSLLFNRFQNCGCLPVRFLTCVNAGNDWTLVIDIPHCDAVEDIEDEVLPFSTQLA